MRKRDMRYECIRVVSMVLVIGAHVLAHTPRSSDAELVAGYTMEAVFFLCNGLFFMLSGKFALCVICDTVDDYKKYYLKRFCSIGIPALVCMLLRFVFNIKYWGTGGGYPELVLNSVFIKEFFLNVFGGFSTCEYWFLYDLAGLLVAAPFLGKIIQKSTKTELWIFLLIGMGFSALQYYLPTMGVSFSWKYPFGGWQMLFLMGAILEKLIVTDQEERAVMLLGGICYLLTVVANCLGKPIPGAYDPSPTYIIMVSAVFLALKRLYKPGIPGDQIVSKIGKYSLNVYLLHMMVLYTLLSKFPARQFFIRIPVLIFLTAVISLALAIILDFVAIAPLQRAYRKLFKLK